MSEANQAATGRKRWTVDRGHMTARYRNAPSESGGAERAGHQGPEPRSAGRGGRSGSGGCTDPTYLTRYRFDVRARRAEGRLLISKELRQRFSPVASLLLPGCVTPLPGCVTPLPGCVTPLPGCVTPHSPASAGARCALPMAVGDTRGYRYARRSDPAPLPGQAGSPRAS